MTKDRSFKRRVRTRMQKTGESYTAARAQLLDKKQRASLPANYLELAKMSDEAVRAKTSRDWPGWCAELDALGAEKLSHPEIARLIKERFPEVSGWWAQSVTGGYERIRGLRASGQDRGSRTWVANKSRTFAVDVARLFRAFADEAIRASWLGVEATIRSSRPNKRIHFDWPDGTRATVEFIERAAGKASAAVQHQRLEDDERRQLEKERWASRFDALKTALDESDA